MTYLDGNLYVLYHCYVYTTAHVVGPQMESTKIGVHTQSEPLAFCITR